MGISFSSSHSSPPSPSPSPSCGMDELPESCVALIMEYLDPPQICKLATLTRTFRAASSADFVWESKLPSNYHVLVRQIFNGLPTDFKNGKRGIYSALCRTNTFDGGTKKLWLDKNIGKLCMCIAAKGLSITGISDRRYWNYIPTEESSNPNKMATWFVALRGSGSGLVKSADIQYRRIPSANLVV
ncbi:F-box protein PP2-A13 isoform X2 [Arachis duranensis]|uniref:F-box protein PP2-A13 isoform X2 n=1 Tax=Arachis duranensis TaxID=130453 RepID=A0A6P4DD50_ARADU|nr:F-box protein PP2-A13 isoform X2 [Arachis duranensis]